MYAYHIQYDFQKNKFIMDSEKVELGRTNDFSKYFSDVKVADVAMKKLNRLVSKCVKTCPQCGRIFWLDSDEQDWYERKGLHIPKKCNTCRNMNKNLREEKEYYG